jgi:glycosyltransferase involved in cell wall biosynthesis
MGFIKPKLICLTPIKNESWILEKFLKCASLWADHIIVADQCSEDNSKEIAAKFPKVLILNNPNDFNEGERQTLLIKEARKIEGPKLLIALDADEVLTSNFLSDSLIAKLLTLEPGTIIKSKFVNLTPDFKHYWESTFNLPWGFMDDNSIHTESRIHNFRFPVTDSSRFLILDEIKIMHFQFTDWERMESKHRWYQCWEKINIPKKSAIDIYREYHHMYSIRQDEMHNIPDLWFAEYKKRGINIDSVNKTDEYYWNKIVLDYLVTYGPEFFRKVAIWDINWVEKANNYKYKNSEKFRDPRSKFQKFVHGWLKKTQADYNKLSVRVVSKLLKIFFKQ